MIQHHSLVAAVFVRDLAHRHAPTVRSLLLAGVDHVVVGSPDIAHSADLLFDDRVEVVPATHVAAFVNVVSDRFGCTVVACDEPVVVPEHAFSPALGLIAGDPRVATVNVWCNFAGYISFPHLNVPSSHQQGDLDERSVTDRLRSRQPLGTPVALPLAGGPLVCIARAAMTACGPLVDTPFDDLSVSTAEFSLRSAGRGFLALLDPITYVTRPFDLAEPTGAAISQPDVREWLHDRHPIFPTVFDAQCADPGSPVAIAHGAARAQAIGLQVLIDGSVMGPLETGTQVQLMNLVAALAKRADVHRIVVAMPGPVPPYAVAAFASPKIEPLNTPDGSIPDDARFDIVHRPFQPDRPLPWDLWRRVARRVVITVQDLIAYRVGQYHSSPQQWLAYRTNMAQSMAQADGIAVFLDDVADQIALERLPVDPSRIGSVPCGTDHLTGQEPACPPAPFLDPELAASRFLVVLGTNYAHKNRDLAVQAWKELQRRGIERTLVVVGAHVPFGSSRHAEAQALGVDDDGVVALLDATSEERNWLLRHADVVIYPTSAEGFGLVPFEAARFGTPTVSVNFGPLAEVHADPPVTAASWSASDLADAILELLNDPDASAAAINSTLEAGTAFTWDIAAEKLVHVYQRALASHPSPARPAEEPRP